MKVSGLMLNSDQPKVLGEFYTALLGKPGFQEGEGTGFMVGAGLYIDRHSDVKGKNDTPGRMMITFETDDVKAEFDRVKAIEGATVIAEPYQPGGSENADGMWLATIADPDGNYLQISKPWA